MSHLPIVNSSIDRVLKALSFDKPDVPPLALSLALQTSRVLGRTLPDVLTDPSSFARAQVLMHERWQHDIAFSMRHAASEAEAFGAPVHYFLDGPPNVGALLVRDAADIASVRVPDVARSQPLLDTLEVVERMKQDLGGKALVAGVAVGPLSGPVMLVGMESWFEMLMTRPVAARELVALYREFSLKWARAQLDQGADLVVWFEPLASTELLPLAIIESHAREPLEVACGFGKPIVLHTASARSLAIVDMAVDAGVSVLSVGRFDDLDTIRGRTLERVSLVGPLDGVAMSRWTRDKAATEARRAVETLGQHGGFILSDAHGEIPYQVDFETLDAVVAAVRAPGIL